jgi:hypothetical protein
MDNLNKFSQALFVFSCLISSQALCHDRMAMIDLVPYTSATQEADPEGKLKPCIASENTAACGVLGFAVNGQNRVIQVLNRGPATINKLSCILSAFGPYLTSLIPVNSCTGAVGCNPLAPGCTCTFTITPGGTATPLNQNINVTIRGNNSNVLTTQIAVVDYGSVYQGGIVFSINDATSPTGSIGGKVISQQDIYVPPLPSNTVFPWDFNASPALIGASSLTNGATNTNSIISSIGSCSSYSTCGFAAGVCKTQFPGYNGFNDWYLPAICELSSQIVADPVLNACPPAVPITTVQALRNAGKITLDNFPYWSSTEYNFTPQTQAYAININTTTALAVNKNLVGTPAADLPDTRCVRVLQ